jgi:hypothetical protein
MDAQQVPLFLAGQALSLTQRRVTPSSAKNLD